MGIFDQVLSGLTGGQAPDFARRFEQNGASGIGDDEALQHHELVAQQLPQGEYEQAATEALSHLSPDERVKLVEHMRQQAQQRDINFPGLHDDPGVHEPSALAGLFGNMQRQQPGLLHQLLGGGGGASGGGQSALGSPVAKLALAGIAAYGLKRMMASRQR